MKKVKEVIELIGDLYKHESNERLKELWRQTHFQGNAEGILKLKKGEKPEPNKVIEITVRGGLIQDIQNIPIGITIRVRDYDTDGDEDRTIKDENGDRCFQADWTKE